MYTRLLPRQAVRTARSYNRAFATSRHYLAGPKEYDNAPGHREVQKEKPLNPHMTNTNSTISNEMPKIGEGHPPPELISSVDLDFVPKDSVPENTERMTGNTQQGSPEQGPNAELGVGEMEGAEFKVEPLRRAGEDVNTTRARLLCPSLYNQILLLGEPGLTVSTPQIRVARGEPSKVTCSSRLLPTSISAR